MIENITQW